MTDTATLEREGLQWHAQARVLKYDQDQTDWATRKLHEERGLLTRLFRPGQLVVPKGPDLAALGLRPYEVAELEKNLLTTAGLTRITSLITAGGGQGATNTASRIGVGDDSTAAAIGNTDLGAGAGSTHRQFVVMDATYPTLSAGAMTFQSSFTSGLANFAWNEWGIDIGTPTVANGTTVAACFLNHKVAAGALGTKATGTWVFQGIITLS